MPITGLAGTGLAVTAGGGGATGVLAEMHPKAKQALQYRALYAGSSKPVFQV